MCNDKAICSNYHAACSVYCGPAEEFLLGQEGQQLFSKTFLLHLITVQALECNEDLKQNVSLPPAKSDFVKNSLLLVLLCVLDLVGSILSRNIV